MLPPVLIAAIVIVAAVTIYFAAQSSDFRKFLAGAFFRERRNTALSSSSVVVPRRHFAPGSVPPATAPHCPAVFDLLCFFYRFDFRLHPDGLKRSTPAGPGQACATLFRSSQPVTCAPIRRCSIVTPPDQHRQQCLPSLPDRHAKKASIRRRARPGCSEHPQLPGQVRRPRHRVFSVPPLSVSLTRAGSATPVEQQMNALACWMRRRSLTAGDPGDEQATKEVISKKVSQADSSSKEPQASQLLLQQARPPAWFRKYQEHLVERATSRDACNANCRRRC